MFFLFHQAGSNATSPAPPSAPDAPQPAQEAPQDGAQQAQQAQPQQPSSQASSKPDARLPSSLADLVTSFESAKQKCKLCAPRL